ncbi:protein kinase family protein [Streptomyces sp. PT12]|uniref:protein kinase family protein n=1 Tax=Streptomyces sp. PT12 TaxID=1510197 RepID=UPI000DE2E34A|nr:protein kinase family protein [Streptomyces sp. PT12]RBM12381.1 hypothetical protein DEH69_19970 [Streptomyces sp. PT12]
MSGAPEGSRLAAYGSVSTALSLLGDRALGERLDAATPVGAGIGGTSALLDVAGTPVFVKRVPLTDVELEPGNVRSTANVFGLPTFCQYGVGGPGFGAWRELAVHTMTTNWVLAGAYEGFPLMYHWRVLPGSSPLPDELADIERVVAYWGGGTPVRRRLEALERSSASIALFIEYLPDNLHRWLDTQVKAGDEAADLACAMVERELHAGVSFMNDRGLLHFDAHFENILTDGRRLFFGDFGLSLSDRFDLSPDEADFFRRHQTYDRCYTSNHLVIWLVTALYGLWGEERAAFVRACAEGERPTGIPEGVAAIIARHAPVATGMTEFLRALQHDSTRTPYPLEAARQGPNGFSLPRTPRTI